MVGAWFILGSLAAIIVLIFFLQLSEEGGWYALPVPIGWTFLLFLVGWVGWWLTRR